VSVSSREDDLLAAFQDAVVRTPAGPAVRTVARGLSYFGEYSLGWCALAAVGAFSARDSRDRRTGRDAWIALGAAAFTAHATSVVLKRVVRRRRPHDPRITVGVGTPSSLSFPSSHVTSTTAALAALSRITGSAVPLAGVPVMMASRLALGVHYPTDVAAGAVLGALTEKAVHRFMTDRAGSRRAGTDRAESKENGR